MQRTQSDPLGDQHQDEVVPGPTTEAPGNPESEGLEDRDAGRLQAEETALDQVSERLGASFPAVDRHTVDALVRTAYEALRHAKVRTYIPILVERRARKALAAIVTDARTPAEQPRYEADDSGSGMGGAGA